MKTSEKMFQFVFENSPVGLVLVNQDITLRDANQYMFQSFHLEPSDVTGKGFGTVFSCATALSGDRECGEYEECADCEIRQAITAVLQQDIRLNDLIIEHSFLLNGTQYTKWFKVSLSRISTDSDTFAIACFADITTQKELELLLESRLSLDLTTGAMNKYALITSLRNMAEEGKNLTIAMIDFDNFKHINDTYGHVSGDTVLSVFSAAALGVVRKQDIVGRYGGEEFMLLFREIEPDAAIAVLQRIYYTFQERCLEETGILATFSAGLCEFSGSQLLQLQMEERIAYVDDLLYQAKHLGKNRIVTPDHVVPFTPPPA